MNKFWKIFLAVFGAIDVAFSIFIPISVALLITHVMELDSATLIIFGIISSIYRAISIGFIKK